MDREHVARVEGAAERETIVSSCCATGGPTASRSEIGCGARALEPRLLLRPHTSLEDRFAAARQAPERLALTLPLLVDGMDDAVSEAFAAWPERMYVVRPDGVVGYKSAPGPWGFDPDEAAAALTEILRPG